MQWSCDIFEEMPLVGWLAVGVASGLATFAVVGLFVCVILRQRRHQLTQQMTSPASLTTELDDDPASELSDSGSCSPAQDIAVSQSTPDLIGHDAAGCLATTCCCLATVTHCLATTRRAPADVRLIDGAFYLPPASPLFRCTACPSVPVPPPPRGPLNGCAC